jgi:hypothetical protein
MLRRTTMLAVAAALLIVGLSGCGAAGEANPEKIGPRGVDELVVPTPAPDPDDFVRDVDNPYLPLEPGTVWTYDVSGSSVTDLEVRVQDGRETVAGIGCVVVHTSATDATGKVVRRSDAYYAQDDRGNVWLFGEEGERSWRAGEDGAEAGLAMPAAPRIGDGFLQERAPGIAEDRSSVLSVDDDSSVPAGTFSGTVVIETTAGAGDLHVVRTWYAEGAGPVEILTSLGGTEHAELTARSQ